MECPLCGEADLTFDEGNDDITCPSCQTIWSVI